MSYPKDLKSKINTVILAVIAASIIIFLFLRANEIDKKEKEKKSSQFWKEWHQEKHEEKLEQKRKDQALFDAINRKFDERLKGIRQKRRDLKQKIRQSERDLERGIGADPCEFCGGKRSRSAKSCPHCGATW